MPPGAIVFAVPPVRSPKGSSGRESYQAPRARKLTDDQEADVRRLAHGRSLRALATLFGVSHETIRAVLRGGDDSLAA